MNCEKEDELDSHINQLPLQLISLTYSMNGLFTVGFYSFLPDANVGGGAAIGVLPALDPDSSGTSGEASDKRWS